MSGDIQVQVLNGYLLVYTNCIPFVLTKTATTKEANSSLMVAHLEQMRKMQIGLRCLVHLSAEKQLMFRSLAAHPQLIVENLLMMEDIQVEWRC